jgi:hypothetical protein
VMDVPMKALGSYKDISKVKAVFKATKKMNEKDFNLKNLHKAEFFILRSTCDDDIHKSIKYGIWTSTHRNNVHLNDVYRDCRRRGIRLFLIFTVVNSKQFSGIAEMTGPVQFNQIFNYWWEELKWSGCFNV